MNAKALLLSGLILSIYSCSKPIQNEISEEPEVAARAEFRVHENPSVFQPYGTIDIGESGAAEISTYDEKTKRLFVVNNTSGNNRIDVIDFSDPTAMQVIASISMAPYGGFVNSVDADKGFLAAAIEASVKTSPGKVVVFNTETYAEVKVINVGSLPDMVTYSPDGKWIMTANEGEPNNDYTIDPPGTVSIISVKDNYAVTTLDFSSFASQQASLRQRGLRIFGPGSSFAQDIEPEYVTISKDSRTAWVTLQENNAIAKLDIRTRTITEIFPLGFKNHNVTANAIDVRDGGGIVRSTWPVYGIYLPDAIVVWEDNHGLPYLFTANEGDAREYTGINPVTGTSFVENLRVSSAQVVLDPTAFPNAATLKQTDQMGRLNITRTLGDEDGDGDFDKLYAFGGRSFSVWNGNSGSLLFDSKNDLDTRAIAANVYDDARSDDKSTEPEGLAIGEINHHLLAFVGLERSNAVAVYDITDPLHPSFLQIIPTGIGPEGVLFISSKDSPNKRSLLVVSSEVDGQVKVFMPEAIN